MMMALAATVVVANLGLGFVKLELDTVRGHPARCSGDAVKQCIHVESVAEPCLIASQPCFNVCCTGRQAVLITGKGASSA